MKKCISVTIILFTIFVTNVMAENTSPLSPAFILKPEQMLLNTEVATDDGDFNQSIFVPDTGDTFSRTANIKHTWVHQGIRFGLSDDIEIGVSETYMINSHSNQSFYQTYDGLYNPTFSAKKTWWSESDARLVFSLAAEPKTGSHEFRALPTRYSAGIGGVLLTTSGLISTINISRSFVNGSSSLDSTTVRLGVYKEIASYSLNVISSVEIFDDQSNGATTSHLDTISTITAVLGRQINSNTWLQFFYQYSGRDYQPRIVDVYKGLMTYSANLDTSYNSNVLGASLKVLF